MLQEGSPFPVPGQWDPHPLNTAILELQILSLQGEGRAGRGWRQS